MTTEFYQASTVSADQRFVLNDEQAAAFGPGSAAYEVKVQRMKDEFRQELAARVEAARVQRAAS